jgi:hypothetical protein
VGDLLPETSGASQGKIRYIDADDSPDLISSRDRAATSSSSASSTEVKKPNQAESFFVYTQWD